MRKRKVEEEEVTEIGADALAVEASADGRQLDSESPNQEQLSKAISERESETAPAAKGRDLDSASSAYTLYLREIGRTALITPQQEVQLAKRIQAGDEEAREAMIKANLRLVVKIARGVRGLRGAAAGSD